MHIDPIGFLERASSRSSLDSLSILADFAAAGALTLRLFDSIARAYAPKSRSPVLMLWLFLYNDAHCTF